MQDYPHRYLATADAPEAGPIDVSSPGLEKLVSAAPAEFDGPGDLWSPETMLVGSVANCFILTFRAVARGSRFEWNALRCEVEGVLNRVDRVTRFTDFNIRAILRVPEGTDEHKAQRLLEKSEAVCLVTNTLNSELHLTTEIIYEP
jgi:organic hydroperoxide reductase OsmC/OhrA